MRASDRRTIARFAMARGSNMRWSAPLVLGVAVLLLVGCSPPGTYPDPNGARNGDGFLVNPRTGTELPGQADPGQ